MLRNGDAFFVDQYLTPLYGLHIFQRNDEGSMNSQKLGFRKFFFQWLEAHQGQNRLWIILEPDFYIVFQPFEIEYICQLDAELLMFGFDKEKFFIHGGVVCLLSPHQFKPGIRWSNAVVKITRDSFGSILENSIPVRSGICMSRNNKSTGSFFTHSIASIALLHLCFNSRNGVFSM